MAEEESLEDLQSSVDPYKTLEIDTSATADQIKSAYRKKALRHHPDKAQPEEKDTANKKFQEIAFAYAILSDERRRKRYDTTGNTSESLDIDDDDFNWTDFFREQYAAVVTGDALDKIKNEYQGSDEEKRDVLAAYEAHEGDIDGIYEEVMCSNVLEDDLRFRGIIDAALAEGQVSSYKKYSKETKASKQKRIKHAQSESQEAMELAEELGVKEKLFGNDSTGKKSKKQKVDDTADLAALIQQRQKGREQNFLENLEAKYGGGNKKKRPIDGPPEEAFEKMAGRGKKKQRSGKA